MTVYIGFVELWTAVTVDGKIFSQAAKVKMAMHKGFVKLCTAATADGDISNQAAEVKMTMHQDLYKYTRHLLLMATTSNQATENICKICNLGFVKLCTVFNDDNISNQLVKNKNDRSQRACKIVHGSCS